MSLGRTFRTVRHLTAEQWIFRVVCRGRFEVARRAPGFYRGYIERTARALPLPNTGAPALRAASRPVLQLQRAVHGAHLDGIAQGRFHFLARTVDFGSIDAIEWRRDLGEKNNPLWRMNLSYMGWLVPLLARGTPQDLARAAAVLRSLEAQNPWNAPGVFRDVWHPYSASHRLINLLAGLALYREAGGPPQPQAEAVLLEHARLCAAFLLHNLERDLQYNHLFKNYVALAVYRAALSAPFATLNFLDAGIAKSLRQQFLPDGGHAERAPMYHALFLLDLQVLSATGSILDAEIANATRALAAMSHPDGDVALFNDSWLGEAPPAKDLGAAAPDGKVLLPDSGYARLAGAGDAVIFDCGPIGPDANPGHAHADFLSVEASVAGRRFLVDPGVPTYSAGPLRDHGRSAAEHNGPHILGREPIEFWQSFRVGRRGRAYPLEDAALAGVAPLWCAGWHDAYRADGLVPARWVGLWPGQGLLIVDRWYGAKAAVCRTKFLIPAAWELQGDTLGAEKPVAFKALIGDTTTEPARWWPRFGEAEAATAILVRPREDAQGAGAATVWTWSGDFAGMAERADIIAQRLAALCAGLAS